MAERLAPVRARQVDRPPPALRQGRAQQLDPRGDVREGADDDPGRQRDADGREHRAAGLQRPDQRAERDRERGDAPEGPRRLARSPRFHGRTAKIGSAIASTIMKGVKAASKKGGPTETIRPVSTSMMSGHIVPTKTTAVATTSRTLLRTSPDSRETVEKTVFDFRLGARQA
jgi:hypothetical protein